MLLNAPANVVVVTKNTKQKTGQISDTVSLKQGNYVDYINTVLLPPRKKEFTCVSMFSGGGGLDLGFQSAGFDIAFSSDVVPIYCETLRSNMQGHISESHDINELTGKYIEKKIGKKADFIIGGPPCQSFSILGQRGSTSDPRGQLVYQYARIIKELRPKGFLFENVPGLLTVNKGRDWEDIRAFFERETGFQTYFAKLNSVEFGVPQYRERVILIGLSKKYDFQWPASTHSKYAEIADSRLFPQRTVKDAFVGLRGTQNNEKRIHSEPVATRYSKIIPGERDRVDHTDRIRYDRPSGTVLVGSGGGGGRPFIHPEEHRHITCREAARLQSFPDWWVFQGGSTAQYRQIGNAVPPLLARHIALAVKKTLKEGV